MGIKQTKVLDSNGQILGPYLLCSDWEHVAVDSNVTLKDALVGDTKEKLTTSNSIIKRIRYVQSDLDQAKSTIASHQTTLNEHGTDLSAHSATLNMHASTLNTHATNIAINAAHIETAQSDISINTQSIKDLAKALVFEKNEDNKSVWLKGKNLAPCANAVVLGEYNSSDVGDSLLVVGNGSIDRRSNAFVLNRDGTATFSWTIKVGKMGDSLSYYDADELVPAKFIKALNEELIRFQQRADLPLTIMTLPCDASISLMHNYEYRCVLKADGDGGNPQIFLHTVAGVSTKESNFASTVIFQGQKAEDPFTITNNITGTPLVYKGESLANTGGIKIVKGTTYRLSFVYDGLQIICYVSTI